MGRVNVKVDIDLRKLQKLQENMKDKYIAKVGILAGTAQQKHAGSNESMVDVAMQHEFGVMSSRSFIYKGEKINIKGIPERSFLRVPLSKKAKKIIKMAVGQPGQLEEMILNDGLKQPTVRLGIAAESIIQEAFATQGFSEWERNISKRYIELKGSDEPLINTGQLRRSILSKVVKVNG